MMIRKVTFHVRAAFTLVEIIVVMGILSLLVGLTLTAGRAMVDRSNVQRTERLLDVLDVAMREWENEADRTLTWGRNGAPAGAIYDLQADTAEVLVITELLATIRRPSQIRDLLARLDADFFYTYRDPGQDGYPEWIVDVYEQAEMQDRFIGELTVLDVWGTPIYSTHPGRVADPLTFPVPGDLVHDIDGTIRTENEKMYGVVRNRRICFISAGPDRQFGSLIARPGQPLHEQTLDNIYSYAPDDP